MTRRPGPRKRKARALESRSAHVAIEERRHQLALAWVARIDAATERLRDATISQSGEGP